MAMRIRRVITGHGADGRSTILFDDYNGRAQEMNSMPGVVLTDIWRTDSSPALNDGCADAAANDIVMLEPAKGGSVFRIVEFPPDSQWRSVADASMAFSSIGASSAHDDESDDPMRHKTSTIDYIVVMKGEIDAIVDTGEVRLKEGDVFVQRGTVHSWSVKGDTPCVIAAILLDAVPV